MVKHGGASWGLSHRQNNPIRPIKPIFLPALEFQFPSVSPAKELLLVLGYKLVTPRPVQIHNGMPIRLRLLSFKSPTSPLDL
ncbi:hypothetical protein DM860_012844 [Cuscuta australis]|uniref:Uncharacterized protein n=1 Tax=Cuscuta australis TaxID=267555 RepID=A0A328DYY5_9ASTE|nr:hypothetical protein DM860_012844 [Cuscuta australis]